VRDGRTSTVEQGRSGHEQVDHTSELTLRVRAPTFAQLVEEATRAFAGLVPGRIRGEPSDTEREFRLDAPDRVALLVDWLNELVYLAEAERWIPSDVRAESPDDTILRVRAPGTRLIEPFVLVKAATLHGAAVRETAGGLEAEVTLDI
jgi:SHS2 domain-containing protein